MSDIGSRKEDHLELCATGEVAYEQTTTLLEEVTLIHEALPELSFDEIDTSCELFGKRLAAPLMISAMTGGTERTGRINRELAAIAESLGLGFALGSQRPMLEREEVVWTYAVRKLAPTTVVIGNLGLWQARQAGPGAVESLARAVGADALAIHLNPAQELVQPGGDRDFRSGLETLRTLVGATALPIVVKETGCGVSPRTAQRLRAAGVAHLDVAGAGGTSWVAVEGHRTEDRTGRALGAALREWGLPTAASVALAQPLGFETLIASGGVGDGLDAARALALGASAVGVARPVLQAYWRGGQEEARRYLSDLVTTLRSVMLLTGSRRVEDLRRAPRRLGPELQRWLDQLGRTDNS